ADALRPDKRRRVVAVDGLATLLRQVERLARPTQNDLERLLTRRIKVIGAGVQRCLEFVKPAEKGPAVVDALARQLELHVLLKPAARAGDEGRRGRGERPDGLELAEAGCVLLRLWINRSRKQRGVGG